MRQPDDDSALFDVLYGTHRVVARMTLTSGTVRPYFLRVTNLAPSNAEELNESQTPTGSWARVERG